MPSYSSDVFYNVTVPQFETATMDGVYTVDNQLWTITTGNKKHISDVSGLNVDNVSLLNLFNSIINQRSLSATKTIRDWYATDAKYVANATDGFPTQLIHCPTIGKWLILSSVKGYILEELEGPVIEISFATAGNCRFGFWRPDTNEAYVWTASGSTTTLQKSSDLSTWTVVGTATGITFPTFSATSYMSRVRFQQSTGDMYVWYKNAASTASRILYKSSDGGLTWTVVASGSTNVTCVATDENRVFYQNPTSTGIYVSTPSGFVLVQGITGVARWMETGPNTGLIVAGLSNGLATIDENNTATVYPNEAIQSTLTTSCVSRVDGIIGYISGKTVELCISDDGIFEQNIPLSYLPQVSSPLISIEYDNINDIFAILVSDGRIIYSNQGEYYAESIVRNLIFNN